MKTYDYVVCDVFTDTRFQGNQLAVVTNAEGLTGEQMQQIAREFNYAESTFVFEGENDLTKKIRIFTLFREMPFAGHPNVGTASVLASSGTFGEIEDAASIIFEQKAGTVEIEVSKNEIGNFFCELKAPEDFSLGDQVSLESLAIALSIKPTDIITDRHLPQIASVGLPFVFIELKNIEVLKEAKINMDGFDKLHQGGIDPLIYMYVKTNRGYDIRSRMFAPLAGVYEDPATGSAGCAVSALLSHLDASENEIYMYKIGQGFEMGRKSLLNSRVKKIGGKIKAVWIGGTSVITCNGKITIA